MGANGPHELDATGTSTCLMMTKLSSGSSLWVSTSSLGRPSTTKRTVPLADSKGTSLILCSWRTRVPAAALKQAGDDDNFWAARRVMAFSDDMIRALVKTGKYSDAAAEKLLADVLIKRRDKYRRVCFSRTNPVVNFSLDPTGTLRFENVAASAGMLKRPLTYAVSWAVLNNNTGDTTPLGNTKGETGQIAAPNGLPQSAGVYVTADVACRRSSA